MGDFGDATGFWIVAAVLAGGIGILLILSLLFARRDRDEPELAQDISLYRQQLSGLSRDEARGVLSGAEAARLKAEIGRRLLEADRQSRESAARPKGPAAVVVPAALIAVAIGGAVFLYAKLGRPGAGDLPMATRLAAAETRMETRPSQAEYVAKLPPPVVIQPEADMVEPLRQLREAVDPAVSDSAEGLKLRAGIEAQLANYPDAILAQTRLIQVLGAEAGPEEYSTLVMMLVEQASGYVSPEAEAALVKGLGLGSRADLDRVADLLLAAAQGFQPQGEDRAKLNALPEVSETTGPLYLFAGELYAQGGRPDRSFALWRPVVENGPQDAFWVPRLREQIRAAAWYAGAWDYQLAPLPGEGTRGPDAAAIADAAGKSETEVNEMATGMVEGLSARLQSEGGSGAEWAQLIRALGVLGRVDEARAMLVAAQAAHPDGPERALIEAAGRTLAAEAAQ